MTDRRPAAIALFRTLLRVFFRRVEVSGLEHVPKHGGGLVVSWHPNGLIDPGLILTHFPRRIVFGARHGLFRVPVLGRLMRAIGTVPIYRAQDAEGTPDDARRKANRDSIDALAREVVSGSFSALFPEGVSHDDPFVKELRPGVARLYYRARTLRAPEADPPVILPVGLHYDDKHVFRSNALVQFHEPLALPPELDVDPPLDEPLDAAQERQRRLMQTLEAALHDVVGATEDWRLHQAMHRARKLVRAERAHRAGSDPGRPEMRERALGFARIRKGYLERQQTHPLEVERVRRRVEEYGADLFALGLDDHDLDRDPRWASPWLAVLLALQLVGVFFLLPPIVLVGSLVNLPTASVLWLLSRRFASKVKDEATLKLLGGIVLFPVTWVGLGLLAAWGNQLVSRTLTTFPSHPVAAFFTTVFVAAAGGALALRYSRLAREALRSAKVRLTRRFRQRAVARLRQERSDLFESLMELAEGLDLPGTVSTDGRVG